MNKLLKKSIVQFSAYIISMIAIVVLVLMPSIRGISANQKSLAESKARLDNLNSQLETLKKLSDEGSDISQKTAIISKYLPDNLDSSSFIVETEGLAKSLNIVIDSFSISSSTGKDAQKSQPQSQFVISAKCSFSQTMALIEQLEKLSRFNTVSLLNVSAISADQVAVQLTGQIYYGSK